MTDFNLIIAKIEEYLQDQLPTIIGNEAVNFFKECFQNEGFTDKSLVKWKDVKRRLEARNKERASANRPILTGETGELADSLNFKIVGNSIIFYSDKDYAQAHNEGTTNAGRNRNVTITKRQFVGPSQTFDDLILKIIEQDLKQILNS